MRVIHLVRHGAYTASPTGGVLTAVGRRQARAAGKRLAKRPLAAIHCSTMSRAIETAEIIGRSFPDLKLRKTAVLREAQPSFFRGQVSRQTVRDTREQFATAFERFFRPSRTRREELIVAHGNLIRWLVCEALGVKRRRQWMAMAIANGSLTTMLVRRDGLIALGAYNQHGHQSGPDWPPPP